MFLSWLQAPGLHIDKSRCTFLVGSRLWRFQGLLTYDARHAGGYEDDRDEGEWLLYTGSGGRDLSGNKRTNKEQSFDQVFEGSNKALLRSCERGLPVRVLRSYKEKRSAYAPTDPDWGIRYDGIYRIVAAWRHNGLQGMMPAMVVTLSIGTHCHSRRIYLRTVQGGEYLVVSSFCPQEHECSCSPVPPWDTGQSVTDCVALP